MTAVFFDLDGTLFDTKADLAATVNHTREDIGLPARPEAEVIRHVGQGARYLLEHSIPERPFGAAWEAFRGHYAEHCVGRLQPYPGVLRTLAALRAAGVPMGINTNKPNFAVKLILEKFALADCFGDAVVAGGDGIALKPDPASLRACAARMGHRLSASDWMVGDSWTDMECAAAAGVRGAFCTYGFGQLRNAPVTVRLGRLDELLGQLAIAGCPGGCE